jgi:hypothetical protein
MSALGSLLKRIFPVRTIRTIGDTRDWFGRLGEFPQATLHPWRRDTIARLKGLKDLYQGKRCFILGNGPSLRRTDLSRLKNEYTIGLNRIFLFFPGLGFPPTVYLAINDLVIEQCAEDIQALKMPRFIAWRSHKYLQPEKDLYFLYTTYTGPKFATDVTGRLWEGATVTYTALQLAYYLGFETSILIGVDHTFTTTGKPNTTVVSQGDDPNHFSAKYFGKGFRWQLPDLETSERSYRMARLAYEKAGRKVLDATLEGKLNVFPKVEYSSLF